MMEVPHEENRQGGEFDPMHTRADIGRERHFTDVIGQFAHHTSESVNQNRDFLEVELEIRQGNLSLFERAVIALGAGDGMQFCFRHFLVFFQ